MSLSKLSVVLLLLLLPTVHAASPLAITSSAFPIGFAGENFTYTLTASGPVASWSLLISDVGIAPLSLNYSSGSSQAILSGVLQHSGRTNITVTAHSATGASATQNWTLAVYSAPFFWTLPAYSVVAGENYTYQPECSVACNLTFKGAPYLSLYGSSLSGTVASGTYTDLLSDGNTTQAWVTSTGTVPSSVSFPCMKGTSTVALLSDGTPECTAYGVFSGEQILANGTGSFSWNGNYTLASGNVYVYGVPGSSVTTSINGISVTVTEPESGFIEIKASPAAISIPPPSGGTAPSSTPTAWYITYELPLIAVAVVALIAYGVLRQKPKTGGKR